MSYLVQRGMGLAECPSLEQLQQIYDPNDPCQNPVAGLSISTSSPAQVAGIVGPINTSGPVASGPCMGTSVPYLGWRDSLGMCQPNWLVVGGVALGLVLLMGAMRR